MPRRRFGVALLLPEPLAIEVDALRRAVGGAGVVARIPPHLTLVPPVNVRVEHVDDAVVVLRGAGAAVRPFRLELGPTATFLPHNPVLHLAVGGDTTALAVLRDAVFRPPLARPLTWPFHPHVTLLETGDAGHVARAADALAGYTATWTVRRVHLLEERRDERGARVWRPIADAPLAPRAVVGRGGLALDLERSERPPPDVVRWLEQGWDAESREQYGPDWVPDEPVAITARRAGAVVGVGEGHVRGREAYLSRLIVAPEARGEGIGSHLLAAFVDHAVGAGCDRVTLRTRAGGPAEALYRARGFEAVAPLPEWRFGQPFVQLVRRL